MWGLLLAPLALAADVGGSAAVNLHFGTASCEGVTAADCRWLDFQDLAVVDGHYGVDLTDRVHVQIAGRLRLHPAVGAQEVGDTTQGNQVQPFTLEVPEAYIELKKALFPALDLRIGQQRFAWGVAYGVNPVDVVNPYDLRDPTQFDARLGIPAISALVHHQQFAVQLVYLPLFRPARMPPEIGLLTRADQLFDFSTMGAGNVQVNQFETRTTMPDTRIGFEGFAGRISLSAPFADLALVGFYGYDSLPQVGGEAVLVGFSSGNRVDIGVPVVYPRYGLGGVEIHAPLFWKISGWIEGAVVFPQREVVTASASQLQALVGLGVIPSVPDPLPQTVIQDGKVFGRWVVGLDRLFGRFAVNVQWIHGLPTERSRADIGDYGALGLQVDLTDKLRLRAQGISDLKGWLAGAHIDWLFADAATITLGATLAGGPQDSTLGQLHPVSNVSLGVKAAF